MLILLSPAKTVNFDIQPQTSHYSIPDFTDEASAIVNKLKTFSPAGLQKLMKINPKLAELNANRFLNWQMPFTPENAKPALLVFKGEVFNGITAESLSEEELLFAQDHLRILSGMYGALRPLDLIQPYRLEMGTKMKINRKKDLHDFWRAKLTKYVTEFLKKSNQKYIVNLASDEYFSVLDQKKLNATVVKPIFKDYHNGKYKFVTVYGKKARGMMVRFILQNRIEEIENLKLFDTDGYFYNDQLSKDNNWVFTRG